MRRLMETALRNANEARWRGDHDWAAFWMSMIAVYAAIDEG